MVVLSYASNIGVNRKVAPDKVGILSFHEYFLFAIPGVDGYSKIHPAQKTRISFLPALTAQTIKPCLPDLYGFAAAL